MPLKNHTEYSDGQLIQIPGPDGTTLAMQFDQQTRTLYTREASLVFSSRHGSSHIGADPIPLATCTSPGLMAADDKCRLDSYVGTRVGVLGFQGAGFPDDGGWMTGDIILAAGSETISLERVGNVVRFVVDIPAVYTCNNEDCVQIFWLQDESDINAIRAPINGGKLPGVNSYGELKVFLFPENQIFNPASPATTLAKKGFYPSFVFKRYDDGIGNNEAELDVVLKRNASGTTQIGWGFTPGATGKVECVWFCGLDEDGSRISFKLDPNLTAGGMGSLLYNGHSITKKAAVITGYHSTVVQTNKYYGKWWNIHTKKTVDDVEFEVVNAIQFDLGAGNNNTMVTDSSASTLLSVGQVIDVWSYKVGDNNGQPVYVHYCKEQANINPGNLWTTIGSVQFGDMLEDFAAGTDVVSDIKVIDQNQWGVDQWDGVPDVYVSNASVIAGSARRATVQTAPPALVITEDPASTSDQERPVMIWHRASLRDCFMEVDLARPTKVGSGIGTYPPIDVLLRAPLDSFSTSYAFVEATGTFTAGTYNTKNWVRLAGVDYNQFPRRGRLRLVNANTTPGAYGTLYSYSAKMIYQGKVVLVMDSTSPATNDVVENLHEDYTTPALRLQFNWEQTVSNKIFMRPMVGTLRVSGTYSAGSTGTDTVVNDLGGTFINGDYTVGRQYSQNGLAASEDATVVSSPEDFLVLTGVGGGGSPEKYNKLQVLVQDEKVWVWWNGLLIPPSRTDSLQLPTPTDVTTAYFPINDTVSYGKFGLRLWPGAQVRRIVVRSRPVQFSEFTNGQLEVN